MSDIIFVGSGPSTMMAVLKLLENDYKGTICILDKGEFRTSDGTANVTEGFGGSGSFSDSKINLTHKVGGTLHNLIGMPLFYRLLKEQEDLWLKFKSSKEQILSRLSHHPNADVESRYFTPQENASELRVKALEKNLDLDFYETLHVGTDNMYDICVNIYKFFIAQGVSFVFKANVQNVNKLIDNTFIVEFLNEYNQVQTMNAKRVIVAPGRSGASIINKLANNLGLTLTNNGIDIGVRCEMSQEIGYPLKKYGIYEPKFWGYKGKWKTKTRSFCYCPENAFVALEEYRSSGIKCVNGHSYSNDGASSGNLNFAVLATTVFTEPCHDALGYIESVAKQVNIAAGGGALVQRYEDLLNGRRSTEKRIMQGATIPSLECYAGDLGLVLPGRQLDAIVEFLKDLGKVMPGVASGHTLLYAPEVKFYSSKVKLDENSMSEVENLYFAGDGSGHTRGLNQASIHGLVIGEAILREENLL